MIDELRKQSAPWMIRSFPKDANAVTRWFRITTEFVDNDERTILVKQILGWDASDPPSWISTTNHGRIINRIEQSTEIPLGISPDSSNFYQNKSAIEEIRRIEAPVSDWSELLSAKAWNLHIPLVVYELWCPLSTYDQAISIWKQLTNEEKHASGIGDKLTGYLGSAVVLIPQIRPYFIDFYNLVLPGLTASWGDLRLVSEVRDGSVVIARATELLQPEPWRELETNQRSHYVGIHNSAPNLAALNEITPHKMPGALARHPETLHGISGSDWRLSVIGADLGDSVEIGLIRGIGNSYFTKEPWRNRSPSIGFSTPARVVHVPPSEDASSAAFEQLQETGYPSLICDPYAEQSSLDKIKTALRGGRLITNSKQVTSKHINEKWARELELKVRTYPNLHDRFIIGPQCGFLIGSSLNGIGKKHSFLIRLDAVMQQQIRNIFDVLWRNAKDPWQ